MDEVELRELVPQVLSVLVGRGADFATAEEAVQEALIGPSRLAGRRRPMPRAGSSPSPGGRSSTSPARTRPAATARTVRRRAAGGSGPTRTTNLRLYFLCAHPALTPSSAVALTLRAVGGLTTGQIAQAYLVPESTMAQRISRANARSPHRPRSTR